MDTIDYGTIWVCACCLFAREGDGDGCYGNGGCEGDPWSKVDFGAGFKVALGLVAAEHDCGREHGTEVEECDCEHRPFTQYACEGCGNALAGDRWAYWLFKIAPEQPAAP